MNRPVLTVAAPVLLWSLHFAAVYALISAACAPRALIDIDLLRAIAGIGTLLLVLPVVACGLSGIRYSGRVEPGSDGRLWATAASWTATMSLGAILLNLWPVATLPSCTG